MSILIIQTAEEAVLTLAHGHVLAGTTYTPHRELIYFAGGEYLGSLPMCVG